MASVFLLSSAIKVCSFGFTYYNKKVMTYTMTNKTAFTFPTERYLNIVKRGYQDCNLNKEYLKKSLRVY